MIDNRTPHLDLPLPSEANKLNEDLPRLREALTALDAGVHGLQVAQDTQAEATQKQIDDANAEIDRVRGDVEAALEASTQAMAETTGQLTADLTRRVRRLQISQLIDLNI